MLEHTVFALSAFVAQVLTNLDNLAALTALMLVSGPRRSIAGFLLAQFVVIAASLAIALGVEDFIPGWAGYLGLAPLALGLFGIARQFLATEDSENPNAAISASVSVTTLLFISLSLDTFAVLAPLLADSAPSFRAAGTVGACVAVLGLAALALLGSKTTFISERLAQRLEKLAPYVMVCAGLYILSNSWTDAI